MTWTKVLAWYSVAILVWVVLIMLDTATKDGSAGNTYGILMLLPVIVYVTMKALAEKKP